MRIVAILAGALLYALALPPFGWSVFGWITLTPLLVVVRGRSPGAAFLYGLLFGFSAAAAVAWWLGAAVADYFGVGVPVGVGVAWLFHLVGNGLPIGLFAAGYASLGRRSRTSGTEVLVAALWVVTEFVRARFLGHPWGLLGYTQHENPALLQIAAVTGVYGISFLLALGNAALAEVLVRPRRRSRVREAAAALWLPGLALVVCWGGGAVFLTASPVGGFGARHISVVQTNVPPVSPWTRAYTERQLSAHIRGTEALPHSLHPALIVWPENALPRYLEQEPGLAVQLADLAKRSGADLLFGGPRYEAGQTYNSARLITADGRYGGHYDKQHLLLFAEEKPFTGALTSNPQENPSEFTSGDGPGVLRSFLPLGVSICHEIIFPELIGLSVAAGAEVLVNLANDGWLDQGYGFAAEQHLAMAKLRAVETRRYLVRAATTGPSAVVDPYGRVLSTLSGASAGTLVAPIAGRAVLTPYVRFGDAFAIACAGIAVVAFAARSVPVRRRLPHVRHLPVPS